MLSPVSKMNSSINASTKMRKIKGANGEKKACDYLVSKGYLILANNWYCSHGELDIVAYKKPLMVFVEVKYRTSLTFGNIHNSINYYKKRSQFFAISRFYEKYNISYSWRFDLITVQDFPGHSPQLHHFQGVPLVSPKVYF